MVEQTEQCLGCGRLIGEGSYCADCLQEAVDYKINHINIMDMLEHGSNDIYMV